MARCDHILQALHTSGDRSCAFPDQNLSWYRGHGVPAVAADEVAVVVVDVDVVAVAVVAVV